MRATLHTFTNVGSNTRKDKGRDGATGGEELLP